VDDPRQDRLALLGRQVGDEGLGVQAALQVDQLLDPLQVAVGQRARWDPERAAGAVLDLAAAQRVDQPRPGHRQQPSARRAAALVEAVAVLQRGREDLGAEIGRQLRLAGA